MCVNSIETSRKVRYWEIENSRQEFIGMMLSVFSFAEGALGTIEIVSIRKDDSSVSFSLNLDGSLESAERMTDFLRDFFTGISHIAVNVVKTKDKDYVILVRAGGTEWARLCNWVRPSILERVWNGSKSSKGLFGGKHGQGRRT